jgi:hypothetical protein
MILLDFSRRASRGSVVHGDRTSKGTDVELTFLGSSSVTGDCPSLYATDRGTYVVQGLKLDPAILASLTMPDRETAVEIPAALLHFLPPEAVSGA